MLCRKSHIAMCFPNTSIICSSLGRYCVFMNYEVTDVFYVHTLCRFLNLSRALHLVVTTHS